MLDFDTINTDWGALAPTSRGPVTLDFGVQTIAEVNEIIEWVRGLDQAGQRSRQMPYDFDLDGTETYSISGIRDIEPRKTLIVTAVRSDGTPVSFEVIVRLDTEVEVDYYRHGGILPYVLRKILAN